MTNLSSHFTLEEMVLSQTAAREGIDNTPSPEIVAHLQTLAGHLEEVRALLGKPMIVSSGYRSPALNAAVGGVPTSAHTRGFAVDFICPAYGSPVNICHVINESVAQFDQLIFEHTWVHFAVDPAMRRQVLTLDRATGGYLPGIVG